MYCWQYYASYSSSRIKLHILFYNFTILNNVLQKVTILLLTMFTILSEPHQKSGRTMIIYCTFCKYVIVICMSYISRPTCYYVLVFFLFYTTMSECMICYGPTVPEINYSILFYSILFYSILFYSILFYSILFYSILFYSILFYSIIFYSILFYSILFYSIL